MIQNTEQIATTLASLRRCMETYISYCYQLAGDGREDAAQWRDEAEFADNARSRIVSRLETMVILSAGGYVESSNVAEQKHPVLLVCVGDDESLAIDLAALRQVSIKTGMLFHRITGVTRDLLDAYLRRERSNGRQVKYLHMSVHANASGLQFVDGMVDGNWLSERLSGVEVLLLAGCEGDTVGDWLGVVPYVITLAEKITHEDAAMLTLHVWSGIGNGLQPDAALDAALKLCPPVVQEYVTRHW